MNRTPFFKEHSYVQHPAWKEEDPGVIICHVLAEGMKGTWWVNYIKYYFGQDRHALGEQAEELLRSQGFQPTHGSREIVILKGVLFEDAMRSKKNIDAEAFRRRLNVSTLETACLLWEKFSDEDLSHMGLRKIVVMHPPVVDLGEEHRLCVGHYGDVHGVASCPCGPEKVFTPDCGFAYLQRSERII